MLSYWTTLIEAQVDGAALGNSSSATSILPAGAKFTFPKNFFSKVGMRIQVRATGRISTLVTTPGWLQFSFKLGPTSNIIVAQSQQFVLSTTAKTNVSWWLEWDLTLRALGGGTAANFMHQGTAISEALGATSVAGEAKCALIQSSAPAVGTGFDETDANVADLVAQWQTANASNTLTLHTYELNVKGGN